VGRNAKVIASKGFNRCGQADQQQRSVRGACFTQLMEPVRSSSNQHHADSPRWRGRPRPVPGPVKGAKERRGKRVVEPFFPNPDGRTSEKGGGGDAKSLGPHHHQSSPRGRKHPCAPAPTVPLFSAMAGLGRFYFPIFCRKFPVWIATYNVKTSYALRAINPPSTGITAPVM
jgi:hypothetical protein